MTSIIKEPQINPHEEKYRRWTHNSPGVLEEITRILKNNRIAPNTHPKVCDLHAGDGSVPAHLINLGWREEDVTCIDIYRSPSPLIPNGGWLHIDLRSLADDIRLGASLPPEITSLRGNFDVVTSLQGSLYQNDNLALCDYFGRQDSLKLFF